MENVKSRNEELFEVLLRRAAIECCNAEGEKIRKESYKAEFSKEFEKRAAQIKRSVGRPERIKTAVKIIKNTVISLAVIMGISFSAMLTQPSVYAAVQNVIRTVFSTHDSYEYVDDSNGSIIFDNSIVPEYIPDGYTLRQIFYHDDSVVMMYDTIDEYELHFKYGLAYNNKISVDNENTILQEFENRGTTFYYYEAISQDEFDTLLWYSNKYYFMIKAQLSKDEMLKMAENIK